MSDYKYIELDQLSYNENGDNLVQIQGRIHNTRLMKKMAFVTLRHKHYYLQCVGFKNKTKNYFTLTGQYVESIVMLYGSLQKVDKPIKSTTYQDFELHIHKVEEISRGETCPILLKDIENDQIHENTRLDYRNIDLRLPKNFKIFKLKANICKLYREYLNNIGFIEVQTPKLLGSKSEGGADVFEVNYFDTKAYLAQSPQLHKQMLINSDFDRVYEIGPVFRAEKSLTHRHLTEFIGLDLEMTLSPLEDYHQIIKLAWNLLKHIIENLEYKHNLSIPDEPIILKFTEVLQLINRPSIDKEEENIDDLNSREEKILGKYVKDKYNSDLFVIDQYPLSLRPFYTMPVNPDILGGGHNLPEKNYKKGEYSRSFDIILRGTEISSGAQRVNNHKALENSIRENCINPDNLKEYLNPSKNCGLKDYLNSFKNGSYEHGGFGLGLERMVHLIAETHDVKEASLFPRDPTRLTP